MTDPSRILIAQMARVWLAPLGTAAPAGPVVAMPDGWFDVGLFTPDSLSFATDPSFEEVRSHQSYLPTRRFQTQDAATAGVDLQEWSADNLIAVHGGGLVTKVTPAAPAVPYYRFAPPKVGSRISFSACLEIIDGSKHLRRIIPRAEQVEGVETNWGNTSESVLPLRLSVLGGDLGDPWYDLNDFGAAFDPQLIELVAAA